MKIQRIRYVITRENDSQILCGLAREYHFKDINNVGDTTIKTFSTEKKAAAAFSRSWGPVTFDYKIVKVTETIQN